MRRPIVLATALISLLVPGAAQALDVGVTYHTSDQDRIARVHARSQTTSTTFGWAMAQPQLWQYLTQTYNWTRQDEIVTEAARAGIPLLARLHGMPEYASCRWAADPNDNFRAGWYAFVNAAVRRYRPGGTFWQENPGLSPTTIEWQVHNEPNLPEYWCGATAPAAYGRYFVETAQEIHSVAPQATVVSAGLSSTEIRSNNYWFTRTMLGVPGFLAQAGPIAFHPYGQYASDVMSHLNDFRDVLQQEGHGGAMYATEFGWHQNPTRAPHLYAGELDHKTRLEETLSRMRAQQDALNLNSVFIYTAYDKRSPDPANWTHYAGLYRADGSAKPAASVLPR